MHQELWDKAKALAGERSWLAADALAVVNWLRTHGREVVGVELWRDTDGQPLFVASSNYSPYPADLITSKSVARCTREATAFIARFRHEPKALFNIMWTESASTELNKVA